MVAGKFCDVLDLLAIQALSYTKTWKKSCFFASIDAHL